MYPKSHQLSVPVSGPLRAEPTPSAIAAIGATPEVSIRPSERSTKPASATMTTGFIASNHHVFSVCTRISSWVVVTQSEVVGLSFGCSWYHDCGIVRTCTVSVDSNGLRLNTNAMSVPMTSVATAR